MTRTTTPNNTVHTRPPQENAYIIGVNLVCPGGPIEGEITLPRRLSEIVECIIAKISPSQDNQPIRSLRDTGDGPEIARRKLANIRDGRLISAAVRRHLRAGAPRAEALRLASSVRGRTPAEAEILLKFHNRSRADRIEQMRIGIIRRGQQRGLSNRQLAERLNVTPQHIGRLIAELEGGKDQ